MEDTIKDELTWKVCPAAIHPWKGVCAWLVIIGTAAVIVDTNLIVGICSFAFLLITLATFIFPSTFTIDEEGIRAKYPLHKKKYSRGQYQSRPLRSLFLQIARIGSFPQEDRGFSNQR